MAVDTGWGQGDYENSVSDSLAVVTKHSLAMLGDEDRIAVAQLLIYDVRLYLGEFHYPDNPYVVDGEKGLTAFDARAAARVRATLSKDVGEAFTALRHVIRATVSQVQYGGDLGIPVAESVLETLEEIVVESTSHQLKLSGGGLYCPK